MDFNTGNFATNIILSLIGLIGYGLYKARKYVFTKGFDWNVFFADNKVFWIWAFLCQLLYSSVSAIFPPLTDALAQGILSRVDLGFEVPVEYLSVAFYLASAWLLSVLSNKGMIPADKIGKAKEKM